MTLSSRPAVSDQQTLNSSSFLAGYRQALLREAAGVLLEPAADDAQFKVEAYPRLAAMLSSAIEQLRVADDELQRRDHDARLREEEWSRRVARERLLFEESPAVLVVTDTAGTILDANKALRDLLDCDAQRIDRMALAEFIPRDERQAFRNGLTHVLAATRVDDWRFRLVPRRHVAVEVSAAVGIVDCANRLAGTAALCWYLRPSAT